jgi:hypothetical protein
VANPCAGGREEDAQSRTGRDEYGFDLERRSWDAYAEWHKKYDKQDRLVQKRRWQKYLGQAVLHREVRSNSRQLRRLLRKGIPPSYRSEARPFPPSPPTFLIILIGGGGGNRCGISWRARPPIRCACGTTTLGSCTRSPPTSPTSTRLVNTPLPTNPPPQIPKLTLRSLGEGRVGHPPHVSGPPVLFFGGGPAEPPQHPHGLRHPQPQYRLLPRHAPPKRVCARACC